MRNWLISGPGTSYSTRKSESSKVKKRKEEGGIRTNLKELTHHNSQSFNSETK